ncbi:MAG: GNAT family N-acetyltransferase [Lentisphaerae bacterium]|nr:GNAT family N-acetyltransferase [Lentisphaerota bacterium]
MTASKQRALRIRNAGFQDMDAVYALIKEHPRELLPRAISDIAQNIDRIFVCEAGGRILGTASWQILPEIGRPKSPSIEIKSVSVTKRRRHKGVGTALIKAVIRHIRQYHPSQIVVLTFAPDFFRQFGFREVAKETLLPKLYMGCINCTKYDNPLTCPEIAMTLTLPSSR